jgi:hypothetical protein
MQTHHSATLYIHCCLVRLNTCMHMYDRSRFSRFQVHMRLFLDSAVCPTVQGIPVKSHNCHIF